MKIVVGLPASATPDYVDELVDAGANEFFVGYLPDSWSRRFGHEFSPNRRYFAGAQQHDLAQLRRLARAVAARDASLAVTFNEHFVTPEAMVAGESLLADALDAGCQAVIVADPSILKPLAVRFPEAAFHVSGDAGISNRYAAQMAFGEGARRVIFPRELGLADLSGIVASTNGPGREFEAFVMGEPCVFDGARCFTEHGYDFGCDFCNFHDRKLLQTRRKGPAMPLDPPQASLLDDPQNRAAWGLGKCGLCAIPALSAAGVTHLKVPGRASHAVHAVRLVRRLLDSQRPTLAEAQAVLDAPGLCASRTFCYFPEVHDD